MKELRIPARDFFCKKSPNPPLGQVFSRMPIFLVNFEVKKLSMLHPPKKNVQKWPNLGGPKSPGGNSWGEGGPANPATLPPPGPTPRGSNSNPWSLVCPSSFKKNSSQYDTQFKSQKKRWIIKLEFSSSELTRRQQTCACGCDWTMPSKCITRENPSARMNQNSTHGNEVQNSHQFLCAVILVPVYFNVVS